MTRIHILGGTGYAGAYITHEAAKRGHQVVSFSRSRPAEIAPGVTYTTGDASDDAFLASVFDDDPDVVISALSPRGALEGEGKLRAILRKTAGIAAERGVRFGVIGGAGSLLVEPGGPRFVDTPAFPEIAIPEASELAGVLDDLRAFENDWLDWFLVSPAPQFGSHAPGEALGHYRVGGDVILADENGLSAISGADFAVAVVDEIEKPTHRRKRFTVAY